MEFGMQCDTAITEAPLYISLTETSVEVAVALALFRAGTS